MFSKRRAARLCIADESTVAIIAIHSNVERNSLWNVCNPHHLNPFDTYETTVAGKNSFPCRARHEKESLPLTPTRWSVDNLALIDRPELGSSAGLQAL
jgi:hypothetical protein